MLMNPAEIFKRLSGGLRLASSNPRIKGYFVPCSPSSRTLDWLLVMDARCQNWVQGLVLCLVPKNVWRWSPVYLQIIHMYIANMSAGSHQSAIHTDRTPSQLLIVKNTAPVEIQKRHKDLVSKWKMFHINYLAGSFHQRRQSWISPTTTSPKDAQTPATAHLRIQVSLHHQHVSSTPWGKNMTRDTKMLASGNWAQKHHVWCIHWEVSGALQNPPKHAVGGAFLSKVYVCRCIYIHTTSWDRRMHVYWLTVLKYVVSTGKSWDTSQLFLASEFFPGFVPGSSKYALTLPVLPANKFTEIMEASNGRSQR